MSGWHWEIQVIGDRADLELLTRYCDKPPIHIFEVGSSDGFHMASTEFDQTLTPEEVVARAAEILQTIAGLLRIEQRQVSNLGTGAVIKKKQDGTGEAFLFFEDSLDVHVTDDVHIQDEKGNFVPVKLPVARIGISEALNLAFSDPIVGRALRLYGTSDKNWVDLYRVVEVLEKDIGGHHAAQKITWFASSDLRRFKHSANSVTVGGDAARHGVENGSPPSNPMTLLEAESFVFNFLGNWLEHKRHLLDLASRNKAVNDAGEAR